MWAKKFSDATSPQRVQLSKEVIKQVACGGHHTVFLDRQGRIYSCGNNSYGQTGHRSSQNLSVPQMVYNISNKQIEQIACGWNHTLVLVAPYYVYATGLGKYGELGLRDFEMRKGFTLIEALAGKNLVKIFAGGYHSWFLFDYREPDLDYEPPSPLLTTPIHSINEEEPNRRRPRSQDSSNVRKKRFGLEEMHDKSEKRYVNIRSDDDFKRLEDLLTNPRIGFAQDARSEQPDAQRQRQGMFSSTDYGPDRDWHKQTEKLSPFKDNADRGRLTVDGPPHRDPHAKFSIHDNFKLTQAPMTPRSKFHQQVDKHPELGISGSQQPSSDEEGHNRSVDNGRKQPDLGFGGKFQQAKRPVNVPPLQISDDEKPPSINESEEQATPKSREKSDEQSSKDEDAYEAFDREEEEEEYKWYKNERNDPLRPEIPPKQGKTPKPSAGNHDDDSSESQNHRRKKKRSRDEGDANRRFTADLPQHPGRPLKKYEPQLTDDFGYKNESEEEEDESPKADDDYEKLSRKMRDLLARNKTKKGKTNDQKELDDLAQKLKKASKKPTYHPTRSSEDEANSPDKNAFTKPSRPVNPPPNKDVYSDDNQNQFANEFRGSFSHKPTKSDKFFDDADKNNRAQKPSNKVPPKVIEDERSESEEFYDNYRAVKKPEPEPRKDKRKVSERDLGKPNDPRGKKVQEDLIAEQNSNLYDFPQDPYNYNSRGQEYRAQRNVYKKDFNLFFVDLKFVHRFAIIFCNDSEEETVKRMTKEVIENLRDNDPQISIVNFLPSQEFYEKKGGFLADLQLDRIKGVSSQILMIVAQPEKFEDIQKQKRLATTNYSSFEYQNTAIGPMYILAESQILENERLRLLCHWYFAIKDKLAGKYTNIKFYELRPSKYK